MASGTRSSLKAVKIEKPTYRRSNLEKSEKALLFASFVAVSGRQPPVKPTKFASEIKKHCEKIHGWAPNVQTVRRWARRWGESGNEFCEVPQLPKTYKSKRKRVSDQIESQFKKKKSCEEVAFEEFDDDGEKVTISGATAFR